MSASIGTTCFLEMRDLHAQLYRDVSADNVENHPWPYALEGETHHINDVH